MKSKKSISDEVNVGDVLNLMMKNSATKSDLKNTEDNIRKEIKLLEKSLREELASKEDLKNLESVLRRDLASKKDLVSLEEKLVDAMGVNTNKILSAILEMGKVQDEKLNRNYADLLTKINLVKTS